MTLILDKNSTSEERQKKIEELQYERQRKKYEAKKSIINETFGKVQFDESKTALEIYQEMRNEWK